MIGFLWKVFANTQASTDIDRNLWPVEKRPELKALTFNLSCVTLKSPIRVAGNNSRGEEGITDRPHPKDGEGNVFSLFVSPHQGGTPPPSHNTSTGPMFFSAERVPHLYPTILPLVPCPFGAPQWLVPDPFQVVFQSQVGRGDTSVLGYSKQKQDGGISHLDMIA